MSLLFIILWVVYDRVVLGLKLGNLLFLIGEGLVMRNRDLSSSGLYNMNV